MADGILVKLGLNTSAFKRGLNQAQQEAGKLGAGLKNALGQLGGAGGLAGVGGIAALGVAVGKAVSEIGQLSDASANLGLSVEEYQKLGFAFRDVGLSAEEMDKTIATMNGKIGEAAQGSTSANESLNRLGLTYEGIKDLSPAQQFETIAKAIATLPTQAERAAAATDLLGKSGKKLDQLVMGYDAVMAKADEAGNIISNSTADAADKIGDDLAKLGDAFNVLVGNSGIIKFFATLTAGMADYATSVNKGIGALAGMQDQLSKINGAAANSYTGGVSGFFGNVKDMLVGESEGAKITTRATTKEDVAKFKAEQEAKNKLAKEAADKKSDMEVQIQEKKDAKLREQDAKAAKEKLKIQKDVEKTLKDADRVLAESDKAANTLRIENEAKYAEEALAESEKLLKDKQDAANEFGSSMGRGRDLPTLRAIGANLPGNINPQDMASLDKQRNDMINKILGVITQPDFGKDSMKVAE